MITIIDYGLGNIRAFANVYKTLGIACQIASSAEQLNECTKIILPGVGAFDHAMTALNESGMRKTLDELVLQKKVPVVGICVGMQIMAQSSDEGKLPGLGWIDAEVRKIDARLLKFKTKLPHMGWNTITTTANQLFENLEESPRFYFLHSYYFHCNQSQDPIASCNYGSDFTCSFHKANIYGIQFHPEKSHHNGVQLLKNFALI